MLNNATREAICLYLFVADELLDFRRPSEVGRDDTSEHSFVGEAVRPHLGSIPQAQGVNERQITRVPRVQKSFFNSCECGFCRDHSSAVAANRDGVAIVDQLRGLERAQESRLTHLSHPIAPDKLVFASL